MVLLYDLSSSLASIFIECGYFSIEAGLFSWSYFFLKCQFGLLSMIVEIDKDLRQRFLTIFYVATLHDVITLTLF